MASFRESELFNTVLIVDTLNLFIRNFVVVPTRNMIGEHNGGLYGALNSLRSTINRFDPDIVIMALDGTGGSQKRREIFPDYKANRKIPSMLCKVGDYETPEQEKEALFRQLKRFMQYINMLPIQKVGMDNIEADDIIAHITTKLCDNKNVVIASTDKDFLQLVEGSRVRVFRPVNKQMYDEDKFKEDFENINPKNYTLVRAVEGDSSDNIPGIKGLALKTMNKLYGDILMSEESKSVDSLLAKSRNNLNSKSSSKYKLLLENEEILRRNYKLMQLYDTNISLQAKSRIEDLLNSSIPVFTPFQLRMFFQKDQLWSQIKNFDSFMGSFTHLNNVALRFNKGFKIE